MMQRIGREHGWETPFFSGWRRALAGLHGGGAVRERCALFGAALMLLLTVLWMGRVNAQLVPAYGETSMNVSTPVPSVTDAWSGTPAPTPGQYVRPTRDYRQWKDDYAAALRQLTAQGKSADAAALRDWLSVFETAAARCDDAQASLPAMSVFNRRTVRRLLGPPPSPAFESCYGYQVVLPWDQAVYYYAANVIPVGTPYLLHVNGVREGGTPLRAREDIHQLFACAGITDQQTKDVLIKVSGCEGGFDAVNTWDTGYVSVGFIQFITGETGEGNSLVRVLQRMKTDEEQQSSQQRGHVNEFTRYFAAHGVEVRDCRLYVRDPFTGTVHSGAEAVQTIIDDKRVTALFQHAGARSQAFQLAQLREARGSYYLGDAPFRLSAAEVDTYLVAAPDETADANVILLATRCVYGEPAVNEALIGTLAEANLTAAARASAPGTLLRVGRRLPDLIGVYHDVLATEGGLVTLTDRAVQHGVRNAVETFAASVNALEPDHPLTLAELRENENALIGMLKNRIDVLAQRPPAGGVM